MVEILIGKDSPKAHWMQERRLFKLNTARIYQTFGSSEEFWRSHELDKIWQRIDLTGASDRRYIIQNDLDFKESLSFPRQVLSVEHWCGLAFLESLRWRTTSTVTITLNFIKYRLIVTYAFPWYLFPKLEFPHIGIVLRANQFMRNTDQRWTTISPRQKVS